MSIKPRSTPTASFDFEDWLETGTVAQRQVELHNDRAIPGEFETLERRRRIAQAQAEKGVEASVTDIPELADIDAAIEALVARWEASKETWTVRALSRDEIDHVAAQHTAPVAPKKPSNRAHATTKAAHEAAMLEWAEEAQVVRRAADLAYLSVAVLSVQTAKGVRKQSGSVLDDTFAPAITPEQLEMLAARPGRQDDIRVLMEAALHAQKSDVEVPAPFSRRTSETAQA